LPRRHSQPRDTLAKLRFVLNEYENGEGGDSVMRMSMSAIRDAVAIIGTSGGAS